MEKIFWESKIWTFFGEKECISYLYPTICWDPILEQKKNQILKKIWVLVPIKNFFGIQIGPGKFFGH
jgi:hypothetical protein